MLSNAIPHRHCQDARKDADLVNTHYLHYGGRSGREIDLSHHFFFAGPVAERAAGLQALLLPLQCQAREHFRPKNEWARPNISFFR
jgi:hypothetical protein